MQEPHDTPISLIESNAQYAYAGSVVLSFLRSSKCQDCPNHIKASEGEVESSASLISYLREQGQPDLPPARRCTPSSAFFDYYQQPERKFQGTVADLLHKNTPKVLLLSALKVSEYEPFCSQSQFLSLFAVTRIEHISHKNVQTEEASKQRGAEERKLKKL